MKNKLNRNSWWHIFPDRWILVNELNQESDLYDATNNSVEKNQVGFPLLSYFTFSSLLFFLIAIVVLNYGYRRNAIANLIAFGEKENAALAKSLANSLQSTLKPYLYKSLRVDDQQLGKQSEIDILQDRVKYQTKDLSLVKIKVYNLQGMTIFSTASQQIGQDKSQSTSFQTALAGKVKTEFSHRNTFQAIQGKVEDRKLISSYVPILDNSGEVQGVFELYNDVTPLIDKIFRTQLELIVIIGLTLGILYLVLLAIVSRANNLINNQQLALQKSQSQYKQKNEELQHILTELRQTQSQLVQQEKMAALGQLVAGIAHEINTPLGAIQASAGNTTKAVKESVGQLPSLSNYLSESERECFFQLIHHTINQDNLLTSAEKRPLKRKLTKELKELEISNSRQVADTLIDLEVYQDVSPFLPLLKHMQVDWILNLAYNLTRLISNNRTIQTAVDRASKIVFALKNYARQSTSEDKQLAKITDGIETVLQIYHNQIKRDIELIRNYQDIPEFWCYPDELMQVWTNLIHNAIQAMNQVGKLTIATELIEASDCGCGASPKDSASRRHRIKVSITDTGSGMSPEVKARIFDPFYTTKAAGEGSGLGLHISQQIVNKHQGSIEVYSQPGNTIFNVYLPINCK